MREIQRKEIDGHQYTCEMMPVRTAHRTLLDLLGTLGGPVIEAIAGGADNQDQDATRLILGALSIAVQGLDGEVGDRLIVSVFDGVTTDKVRLKPWDDEFEAHFSGRVFSMYKVWAWSVEVNYRDFLDGAQSLGLAQGLKLGKQVLSTHLTPTSASGESPAPS